MHGDSALMKELSTSMANIIQEHDDQEETLWEELFDTDSNDYYYVHKLTGQSQWEKPNAQYRKWEDSEFYTS